MTNERLITGKTKLLGVIGHPVEHSRSPVMHNAAIAQLGLDYVYLPFP
ncbi:MAG: shikimate dehydrogenase, partial [Nostoc sp.]